MKRAIISFCLLIICIGIFYSCKNPCEGNVAKHYFVEIHKEKKPSINRYYTNVYGVGKNAEIYPFYNDSLVETYEVYLNLHANAVQFAFENATLKDTLTITYSHDMHFAGDACGYVDKMSRTGDVSNTMKIVSAWMYHPSSGGWLGSTAEDSLICIQVQ